MSRARPRCFRSRPGPPDAARCQRDGLGRDVDDSHAVLEVEIDPPEVLAERSCLRDRHAADPLAVWEQRVRVRADHERDLAVELRGELAVALDPEVREQDHDVCSTRRGARRRAPYERKPVREVKAHRSVDVPPVDGRETDRPTWIPSTSSSAVACAPGTTAAVALEVRGELRISARRRLVDERVRAVVDDRAVPDGGRTAAGDPEQPMDGDPFVRLLRRSVRSSTSPAST